MQLEPNKYVKELTQEKYKSDLRRRMFRLI